MQCRQRGPVPDNFAEHWTMNILKRFLLHEMHS